MMLVMWYLEVAEHGLKKRENWAKLFYILLKHLRESRKKCKHRKVGVKELFREKENKGA